MNYNKLRYFFEVSRTLNLTRAAQSLYISQPALSKHMADLEHEFNARLFLRTNRNLILTKAGEALAAECGMIFAGEAALYDKVHAAATQEEGSLELAFMGIGMAYRIPDLLAEFNVKYPKIRTSTRRLNWTKVYEAVETGAADVSIKLTSCETYPDHLGRCTLMETHVAAILPTNHPCAGLHCIPLERLKDDTFLFLTRDESTIPHDHAMRMCRDAGFTPRIAATYPNVETVVMMVQAGAGVALLSSFAPVGGLPGVSCVPLEQSPSVSLDLLWQKNTVNPAVDLFVTFCRAFAW